MEIAKPLIAEKTGSLTEPITTTDQARHAIFGLYGRLASMAFKMPLSEQNKQLMAQDFGEVAEQNSVISTGTNLLLFQDGRLRYQLNRIVLLKEDGKNNVVSILLSKIGEGDNPSQLYMAGSDGTFLRLNGAKAEADGSDNGNRCYSE